MSFRILKSWSSWSLLTLALGRFLFVVSFKSLEDNFEWRLIRVYGPNDNYRQLAFFEDLSFMSSSNIPWCLGGDFNVIRFPLKRNHTWPVVLGNERVL